MASDDSNGQDGLAGGPEGDKPMAFLDHVGELRTRLVRIVLAIAVVCLLLLRGAQTPGELRARSGRLHTFADNAAAVDALESLIAREGDPLAVRLPRTPGRKDSEYMHLFSGPVDVEAHAAAQAARPPGGAERVDVPELLLRVGRLEEAVAELKAQMAKLG
jgi:uncharacterized protein YceH (UPF0502 family)